MNDLFTADLLRTFEHRHDDGSWATMEPSHHDPASHDDEAGWSEGVVFVCKGCDEQIRVRRREDEASRP